MSGRTAVRRLPDPARAHGAWVYLLVSVLAGVLATVRQGPVPALLAGVGFVGVFLGASSLALPAGERSRARLGGGAILAIGPTGLAWLAGAEPAYLAYAGVALFPAAASAWFALRQGVLSAPALAFAVSALVVAAPAAACAGGARLVDGIVLLALLAPFFAWRTVRLLAGLARAGTNRAALRRAGLREAAIAVGWTALAVGLVHLLPHG